MKVIKRDGRIVDFDKAKIKIAVEKANKEVVEKEKATNQDIRIITDYIEELGKKRILVEDIQDIIEAKLMELGKYELAKKYIVYRYTRALVRKSNTTDESILGLIRKSNKDAMDISSNKNAINASTQRNLIAGEVSKDLSKRILLPEKIKNAWDEGVLHFHNADYFIQPIFNCSIIDIKDMLDNGTVINGMMIDSPNTFQVACNITSQIISAVGSNQYGGQSIDMIHFGKYLRKSKDKFEKELLEELGANFDKNVLEKLVLNRVKSDLKTGVQTIQYQINTLMTTNGNAPFVTLFLHIDPNDEYVNENAMIIEEILKQKIQGVKDSEGIYVTPEFPKIVYVLDECNNLTGGKYDYLTNLTVECSSKGINLAYISAKKMREFYDGNVFSPMGCNNFQILWKDETGKYKFEGRFNQGIVSINLPQIAILSEGNEEKFWDLLNEKMELCKEALMCRHYALVGTSANISPIHWRYGAIARLKQGEKIDKLLYGGYSTISLGYVGFYEMTKLMKGVPHTDTIGHDFALKVMKYMKDRVLKWRKETNIGFTLYGTPSQDLCHLFAKIDKERFGTIEGITDKGYYTNSFLIDSKEKMDIYEKIKFESEFQLLSDGGAISYVEISNLKDNRAELENIIKFIYNNSMYVELYYKSDESSE